MWDEFPDKVIIVRKDGDHYRVWIDGEFFCSTDTYTEASKEIREYLEQEEK